jgi:hypothetical protein
MKEAYKNTTRESCPEALRRLLCGRLGGCFAAAWQALGSCSTAA